MNFTREPIIETIITPKDGYKIVIRSSKGSGQEEYTVDAVEVVSFGNSFFFRCLERPKCFLVPVADYEVIEVKETKVVLKNIGVERAIKIGGGRESLPKPQREQHPEKMQNAEEAISGEEAQVSSEAPLEHRKRDRKRNRRRRSSEERNGEPRGDFRQQEGQMAKEVRPPAPKADQGGVQNDETPVSSPTFSTLFPPPTTLISETISRYSEAGFLSKPIRKEEKLSQEEERPVVETFIEEARDILHEHMVDNDRSSYDSDLEDTEKLFRRESSHHEEAMKEEDLP